MALEETELVFIDWWRHGLKKNGNLKILPTRSLAISALIASVAQKIESGKKGK